MRNKFDLKRKMTAVFMLGIFFLGIPVNHLAFAEQNKTIPTVDDPSYNLMRKEFLNINPENFDEFVFNDHVGNDSFIGNSGKNIIESRSNEGGDNAKSFGGNYWCKNEAHDNYSLCRYMTGGMINKNTPCGLSMNNDYAFAIEHSENICNPERWSVSKKGARIWIGSERRDNFIQSLFGKLKGRPMNRLCFEIELPQDRMNFLKLQAAKRQVVNPDVSANSLDNLDVELGTYTSIFNSDEGNFKHNPEGGGTFNRGGTHFYHKPSLYGRYPLDKVYALNSNTLIACFTDAPSGVRGGMRPPYSYNPLMTVVGDRSDGQTNAYSYMSHLTRAYFDFAKTAKIKYPATVKFNKIFALYENNDIQALSGNGSVLGVDMIVAGSVAQYPFTIINGASEDRTYRVTFMAGGNLSLTKLTPTFRIIVDDNQNGIRDLNERKEIKPQSLYTLAANTNASFIILHAPNFRNAKSTESRYEHNFAPAGVTFQEIGRLRMTSYAVRTWEGNSAEVSKKVSLLKDMVFPSQDSAYRTHSQWNQDKKGNKRLLRNSPDYRMALSKMKK